MNPGADLLFAADWEGLIKANITAPPDLPTLAELARFAPETVTFRGGDTAAPLLHTRSKLLYLAGGVVVAALAVGALMRLER